MLAEGQSGVVAYLMDHFAGAMIAAGTVSLMAISSVVSGVSGQTIGVGSAGAVMLAMITVLFRTLQQENRRLQRRIEHLEHELDQLRAAR